MDHDRFPITAAYLERLPDGIRSHPQCLVKASVLRDVVDSRPLVTADLESLPAEVVQLVREPHPVSSWIPEVHALVVMLAVRDRHFAAGEEGSRTYEDWTYRRNRRLLARPLYRALFLLLSPDRLVRGVGRRWSMFRRGSSIEVVSREPGRVELEMISPPFLYEETVGRGLMGALRAATELAGGRAVEVELRSIEERSIRYELRWS